MALDLDSLSDAFSSNWLVGKVGVAEFGVVLAEFEVVVIGLVNPNGLAPRPAKNNGNGLIVGITDDGEEPSIGVETLFTQLLLVDCGREDGDCCCCN